MDDDSMEMDEVHVAGGIELPDYMMMPIKWPKRMPKDSVGRRIATMAALHPEHLEDITKMDLMSMTKEAKAILLVSIYERLGIKPTISRRTGDERGTQGAD